MANDKMTLGRLVRRLRDQHGWTLRQMSAKVGIPLSTLAKVEADKLSLNYEKLQQFTGRLGISLTATDTSVRVSTPNYDYEYLCADLREKRMVPVITRIKARDITAFGTPSTHQGEEFVFVLEGTIEVHSQFYSPVTLTAGHGVYLDSTMQHAYTAKDCKTALVLAVCSSEDPNLAKELIGLAESASDKVA